mgnify:CR=1 FL=1
MPDKLDEILIEVRETKGDIKQLKSWLYGENGFEGDIPDIKKTVKNHSRRIRTIEIVIAGLAVTGGGTVGLIKLLGG